jgi:HlyD family secretion protein
VDFNAKVTTGQKLAELDPLIYEAQRNQAKAALSCARANLSLSEAKLKQAARDWKRAESLGPAKAISDADYDQAKAVYEAAQASVAVSQATIEQSTAALKLAETNLGYTVIRSPVDGVVVDRKVDPGQTVASQFQTPVMFVVAPDLEKKIYVYASVDEADIGLIREAKKRSEPVTFTVDAYPKDVFEGKIAQVRLNPTTIQNVVTYTVVVESPNSDLKLLPGMTANLSFQVEKRVGVLKIPNAALRFHPKLEQVCQRDRAIVEGESDDAQADAGGNSANVESKAGSSRASSRNHDQRYVWIAEDGLLGAVKVVTGLSDKSSTELVSGNLVESQEVVVGAQTASTSSTKTSSSPSPPPK